MADVVRDAQQEFWQSPTLAGDTILPSPVPQDTTAACVGCHSEFMIGARFCHTCGLRRPELVKAESDANATAGFWARNVALVRPWLDSVADYWGEIPFPRWLRYLHFHEIQRWVGLSTASLIAFIIGMGCVAGTLGVSLFYRASNLAEFQAIQMWRIEWLLAATASFVAGILLKKSSDNSSGNNND
jgi:hypothetical protein